MFPQSRETFFLSATAHVANDHDEFSYCEVTGQPVLFLFRKLRSLYSEPLYLKLKPLFFYVHITIRNIEVLNSSRDAYPFKLTPGSSTDSSPFYYENLPMKPDSGLKYKVWLCSLVSTVFSILASFAPARACKT
ncbi:MAG: hypothetical protein MESAZ_02860 [Saezia sanguinis]